MPSRTLAWGLATIRVETLQSGRIRIFCTESGCSWFHNFVCYPGRGVSLDDMVLEINLHVGKEH